MRFGLTLCNHGEYADPALLADLAVAAEDAGWDGVFVWDHIARDGEPPMTDPQVALAAIATLTARITIGPMVTPLARRRPWKVAREAVALDHLSGGRTVLGVGLGVHAEEFGQLGEEGTARGRAALLDEALEVITALWTAEPVRHHGAAFDVEAHFTPGPVRGHIPIWVGGTWPNAAPFRRAARYDGVFPVTRAGYEPADYTAMRAFIAEHRDPAAPPPTVVHQGSGEAGDIDRWPAYAEVGVDWWLESFRSEERPVAECRAVIAAGPPSTT
ncbi:LLM class flavin-dependent oxidoreductase [Euzebya sp.]|uniref:LLM class flavin-dependent oxidoreductase n=1 Tax=Euzebya sp. TaxID=1971409 RepID=UPI003516833A